MLKIASIHPNGGTGVKVIIEGANPTEVNSPEARKLALDECGLGGTKSLDPLSQSGSYPVDAHGNMLDFNAPIPNGIKYRADFVVNSR